MDKLKEKQLEIIQKYNPALDDYHTWVRSESDILTFEEAWEDPDTYTPDFDENDAKETMLSGKITVYSSYPIEQGIFVTPSLMEAAEYAGGDPEAVYSKEVSLSEIAWIDAIQGQYANINLEHDLVLEDVIADAEALVDTYNSSTQEEKGVEEVAL